MITKWLDKGVYKAPKTIGGKRARYYRTSPSDVLIVPEGVKVTGGREISRDDYIMTREFNITMGFE